MNSPKISVIIPSYNKVKYIEETLKSIFSQSYKNFEIIIQDGASNDGTLQIIRKYAKKYPKYVKFVSKKDKGQLDAINKGLKKAKGEIVTYINADDIYEKRAFESIVSFYLEHPNSLWFTGKGIVINSQGKEIAKFVSWYKSILLKLNKKFILLIVNYFMQPSVFLTKKALKKYGPFMGTKNFVVEYDTWLKIGEVEMPVVVNKLLTKFRIEENTKTSKMTNILLQHDEKVVKKYTKNIFILILHKLHNLFRKVVLSYSV